MNSIAQLRGINPSLIGNGTSFWVSGYREPNDGGGGIFVYDQLSSATDDGGVVIAPNAGIGRYIRSISGPYKFEWFGAVGDASTDDSAAIQAAINYAVSAIPFAGYAPEVCAEAKVYNVGTTSIVISSPCRVRGNGCAIRYTGTGAAFSISGPSVFLHDIQLYNPTADFPLNASALVGTGLLMTNATKCNFYNVTTSGFAVGRDWYGNEDGSSYCNEYGAFVLHCAIGVRFRNNAAPGSFVTHINYNGGSITTGSYASMVGTVGILIEDGGTNVPNGINFYGTSCEGPYEYKLKTDGERCQFCGIYWDAHISGTDFLFSSVSSDNIVFGGNDLGQQVVSDSGARNLIMDPRDGFGPVMPINGVLKIYRASDPSQYAEIDMPSGLVEYNAEQAASAHVFEVQGAEVARASGDGLKTTAPTTGTAKAWKLGTRVADTVALDTTKYVEIEIEGIGLVKLGVVS